ncbi:MAG: amidohydrolase family protein [Eubacterium sp.]|nr:amidohydrolase family protein [Candidatus Colimonas fimequi]
MKKNRLIAILIAAVMAFAMTSCGQSDNTGDNPSTTIITNAQVETVAGDNSSTAVVIKDDVIEYVGDDEGAMKYDDGKARVIDADGKTVMPTMVEAHMHYATAIQAKYEINIADILDPAEMQAIISDFMKANPDLEVYSGAGWMVSAFENNSPTKDILDEVCPDKPMVLQEVDGHAYWANSKALEELGIDKKFATEYNKNYKKNGGRIVVDDNGEPTGHLKEAAASLVDPIKPTYTVEQCKEAIAEQQEWLHSLGFTTAFDAGILNMGDETAENYWTAMSEMARDGELLMRVKGSFWVHPYDFDSFEECKEYMDGWRKKAEELCDTEYYQITTIKTMADQVLEEGTAYMSEGMYADGVLENNDIESNNIWHGKQDMMEQVLEYAAENGLNMHIHQIGDASATFALDALEKAEAKYPELKENRVCFAHCQFINDEDQQRMKDMGVSAIVAPYWAVMDDYYWSVYLPLMSSQEALDTQYPMQSLEKKGINVAFHSDYVVTQPDMGWLYYSAQTRVLPQKMYNFWYGDDPAYHRSTDTAASQDPADNEESQLIGSLKDWSQALTLDQTIEASTINGAKTLNMEDEIGTIEVGKKADLMLLNINLRTSPVEELEEVVPTITFFNGVPVYENIK